MVSAIVLAGGSGSRMKSDKAKQFIEVDGKPLIYYALRTFEASVVDEIILVTRQQDIPFMREEIVKKFSFNKVRRIVAGGKERYDSVENGIKACDKRNQIIMIHDGARPFVTNAMILSSISAARRYKACTVGMPVKDTIKVVDEEGFGIDTPDRSSLYMIQTPQTFDRSVIQEAYSRMRADSKGNVTDDTMLVEKYLDQKVKVIEGSYSNIKITTPDDIPLAEAILGAM